MIGMIAAVTKDRVIGRDGKIPWRYRGDFARFKRLTMGSTVIMGRKTFESMGSKPLPGRRNVVVAPSALATGVLSRTYHDVTWTPSLPAAFDFERRCYEPGDDERRDVWLIGGSRIYEDGLACADVIDLTLVPDDVPIEGSVLFPVVDDRFRLASRLPHPDEPALWVERYERVS